MKTQIDTSNLKLAKMTSMAHEEYRKALGLPEGTSERLIRAKLAQIEVQSRRREDEPVEQMEIILANETEKFLLLKKTVELNLENKHSRKKTMSKNIRKAEQYRKSIEKYDVKELDGFEDRLKLFQKDVLEDTEKLKRLELALNEYGQLEPTNEALEAAIKELKASRLSLELSFV